MRRLLLTCLFILSSFWANSQTSVYHPFPDSNAVWNYHYYNGCLGSIFSMDYNEYYSITFAEDTFINGFIYHTLYTPAKEWTRIGGCWPGATAGDSGVTYNIRYGAIRQNITEKKVYYRALHLNDTTEYLLYDFGMEVGDTVKGMLAESILWTPPYTGIDTVQSIDSVLVGGNYRKRWIIDTRCDIQYDLVEGIGATHSVISGFGLACVIDNGPAYLTCFNENNGQYVYPDATSSCDMITSLPASPHYTVEIQVFPNPSQGLLTVGFEDMDIIKINITDLLGRTIFWQSVSGQKEIVVRNLLPGTYILTATDKAGRTVNKKIVSHR